MKGLRHLAIALTACAAPTPKPSAKPTPAVVTTPAAQVAETPSVTPPPPAIGFSEARAPSAAARKANRDGLAAHAEGRYEESARLFAAAIEDTPTHAMARFNLACASAKLGRLDDAAGQLRRVLLEDPVTFLPRMDSDLDLEALRSDERWRDLEALAAAVRTELERAIANGVPALLHVGSRGKTRLLRAGAYLPSTRQLVPLVRYVADAGGAVVDLEHERAAVASYRIDCSDHFCVLEDARVYAFALGQQDPIGETTPTRPPQGIALATAPDRVIMRWLDCEYPDCTGPWLHAHDGRMQRGAAPSSEAGLRVELSYAGSSFRMAQAVRKSPSASTPRLPGGTSLRLGRSHRDRGRDGSELTVLVSPDDAWAVALSTSVDCMGPRRFTHALSIVEISTGAVHPLTAPAHTHASGLLIARDGGLYVQSGASVLRWPSVAAAIADEPDPLPPGMVLFVPRDDDEACELAG